MASPMIPPDSARRLPRLLRLGRRADRTACRRRLVPPLFPGVGRRWTAGGADGCAAAARGPAAVHLGRRMAGVGRPQRARNPRPRSRHAGCCCSAISATSGCAKRSTLAPDRERELYELATDVLVHLAPPSADGGLAGSRPRPMARRADAVHRLVLPGGRHRGRCRGLSRGPGPRCLDRSPTTASARSPCCAIIMPRTSCWSRAATASPISACSISRTRLSGHPAYDLASVLEDARRDVAPELERAMLDRYIAATGRGEAFERAYWALAAQRNTRILGVFTRLWKRDGKAAATAASSRACGGCWSATCSSPCWRRCAPGSTPTSPNRPAARHGWRPPDGRSPLASPAPGNRGQRARHGDGHGRRPRQAHAAADRKPAQAADRGRRQAADRPCPRPAARRRRRQGGGQRPLSGGFAGGASRATPPRA